MNGYIFLCPESDIILMRCPYCDFELVDEPIGRYTHHVCHRCGAEEIYPTSAIKREYLRHEDMTGFKEPTDEEILQKFLDENF